MRVARSVTAEDVEIVEVPDPVAGPGDVIARVLACGVCGSDVSRAWVAKKVPVVLGHELCAEIEAVDAGADTALRPGDRVVVHHHAACGECRRCRRGSPTLCEQFRTTALDPGGFAERVRIPPDLVAELLPLDGLDVERGTFTEPLACVLRAFGRLRLGADDRLLVVGAGTSGLLAIAAARAWGLQGVRVREPRTERRELAVTLGATTDAPGGPPVDAALVCTPSAAAIADAAKALGPGGRLCLYAPPDPRARLDLPALELYMRELEVHHSYSAGPGEMRAALDLLRTGAVDPAVLVTHRVGLDGTARALDLQRTGEAIKALVVP
jgi:L-iditol 2-dehydrogenase